MQIETADVSLIGHREENQDRVAVAAADHAVLLVVIDGMGGHAEGARAAETALSTLLEAFWQTPHPIFDPLGFLHLSLGRAHEEVVKLGVVGIQEGLNPHFLQEKLEVFVEEHLRRGDDKK